MEFPDRYHPAEIEPLLQTWWQDTGIYHFDLEQAGEVFSIDTPPPTVSGNLHLGHVYSYSHVDFIARYKRMQGWRVFYPMGYDDNGLPTERLVEKQLGLSPRETNRKEFIEQCLQVSESSEKDYQALWKRLGLSVDWRYTYRTISERARRIAQWSFVDLVRQGLAYRRRAPAIWCPQCGTSIAQAEVNDLERESEFVFLKFFLASGLALESGRDYLPIATTRPELLPACVAVFIHPEDGRYQDWVGKQVRVPLFDQMVPVLADAGADPHKGTGVVMCCTFGDAADVAWWYNHGLPLVEAVQPDGRMSSVAGRFSGLSLTDARRQIGEELEAQGILYQRQALMQTVRVHERCDTPVELLLAQQWFLRTLDHKRELSQAGKEIAWYPEYMAARYQNWVEGLSWDWCLSRQRSYGVPFPVWYCLACGEILLAKPERLPVDPLEEKPEAACPRCGSLDFTPETDVMDTWATSSLSPQIAGGWEPPLFPGEKPGALYAQVFPFSLRPQAHEIIRTWAFYTILKSQYHFDALPWKDVLISGWGLAGEGQGKISKSRGGGPLPPLEMIERYSADAVRYWAASTGPGKDSLISEEKIQAGARLVTKLWNVARFVQRFLEESTPELPSRLSPADRWILARTQRLVRRATALLDRYDYATAKSEIEASFWADLADNYLEMCKQRLYLAQGVEAAGARFALRTVLLAFIKLLAPFLPYVTEAVYQNLVWLRDVESDRERSASIHRSNWPQPIEQFEDPQAEQIGEVLMSITAAVRRYKSEHNLPLGSTLNRLQLAIVRPGVSEDFFPSLKAALVEAAADLESITRARQIEVVAEIDPALEVLTGQIVQVGLQC